MDDRCFKLLLRWEALFDQGQEVSPEELCRDCPELIPSVREGISQLRRMRWVNGVVRKSAEQGVSHEAPDHSSEGQPQSEPRLIGGRYRLERPIAEGGFGEVWRGFDEKLNRAVAVKVPKRHRIRTTEEAEGFLEEARKAASLEHPGIVPVYDVVQDGGTYFIVSKLIEGDDLGKRLSGKPLSVKEAVRLVAQVAKYLNHAHRKGFIHRDIKPANLLVDADDNVFITDFGIAVSEAERHTSGDGCGTLAYMSPEQIHGDPARIDARTDIYSLGVILYQLLTGRLPFSTTNPVDLRKSILHLEPPPLSSLIPALPFEVERICMTCMAKNPTERFASAEQLTDHLYRFLHRRMTEFDWLTGMNPTHKLGFLRDQCHSTRKIRLFVCACARSGLDRISEPPGRSRRAVEVAERYADGLTSGSELAVAGKNAWGSVRDFPSVERMVAAWTAHSDVWTAAFNVSRHTEPALQCKLLLELFGHSVHHPPTLHPAWLSWNDGLVPRLAQAIYDQGRFELFHELADALEGAGCTSSEVIGHCRSQGSHVRGCWVVDLILAKDR